MPRRRNLKVVPIKKPIGDPVMVDTLVFLLDHVRNGKICAMSICLIGEREDGSEFSIESATAEGDDRNELQLLGLMRGAEREPHWAGKAVCVGCPKFPFGADESDALLTCSPYGGDALTAYKREGRMYVRCMGCGTDLTEASYG